MPWSDNAVQSRQTVPLIRLLEKRYARILCYPKYDREEAVRRLQELKHLEVKALEFAGEKAVFNMPVLGKGCVGIVVGAYINRGKRALKIRRADADRKDMHHEALMLKRANAAKVGPNLIGLTENFLLMEFVEGMLLPKWIELLRGRGARKRIRSVLREILEQCWRLDEAGLDHGELSRAPKHVIVKPNDEVCIIDFETASAQRKVSNVTSMCQYLFIGSQVARVIRRRLSMLNEEVLVDALRRYKQQRSRENFSAILNVGKLNEH